MGDIAAWLETLGLGKYAETFTQNEIDFEVLPQLTEEDIRELGLPLGPRRKLLTAIAALTNDNASKSSPEPSFPEPTPKVPASQAERRQLTVMFIDLVGSTSLSEQLDPEDLSEIMRLYRDCCTDIVNRYAGYIAKFMGDGILVYFGYPQAHEDDAERSVRTAWDITQVIGQLTAPAGQPLQVRIGIATGLVVVGEVIGHESSQEQTVVGETPNLAARLQAMATPGQILIAGSSRQLLGNTITLADLGEYQIKGLSTAVHVYAVQGLQTTESRFVAHRTAALSPMVGRNHELAVIHDYWRQAHAGKGKLLYLSGEAGIGKSRLVEAMAASIITESHYRISYQCSPYHTDSAWYPIIEQLSRAANFAPNDDTLTRLTKLEALLAIALGDTQPALLVHRAALIAALLGIEAEARYGKIGLSPLQQRKRLLETLIAHLFNLAERQTVLITFEDAHWIDPSTAELIGCLLNEINQTRVLLLLTARPDFSPDFTHHPLVIHIALNRLERESAITLVHHHADGYSRLGQISSGLDALDEALTIITQTGELWWQAEVYRSKGELLLQGKEDPIVTETCFNQALNIARHQQARSLELRAALSLAKLWQQQGKHDEAHRLLDSVFGWFTEGFDTADLNDAKALLEKLA